MANPFKDSAERCMDDMRARYKNVFFIYDWKCYDEKTTAGEAADWLSEHITEWAFHPDNLFVVGIKDDAEATHFKMRWR